MEELEWDIACRRLEGFLDAHGTAPRERLLALALEILAEAKSGHAGSPLERTMRIATTRTRLWFERLAGDPTKVARTRAIFLSDPVRERWGSAFLDPEIPADLVSLVREACVEAGPTLEFQSLVRREMDYGAMEDIARETWDQFSWSHVLRAFALWTTLLVLAYAAYLRFLA